MAALQALRIAASTVERNPILFVATAIFSLFQLPGLVAQSVDPLLGSLVSFGLSTIMIFVMPFFLGGVIGMANEGIDGTTSIRTLLREGKAHYVSLLVVYLGLAALNFVFGFISFFAIAFGGLFLFEGLQAGVLPLLIIGVVGLLVLLAYLLVVFVTQFFSHAIVVDDLQAVDGIKRSVWCVRNNLLPVIGYTVIVTAGGMLFGLFIGVFSLLTSPAPAGGSPGATGIGAAATPTPFPVDIPSFGVAGTIGLAVLFVIVTGLFGGFFSAYSTAFYRSIRSTVER